MIAVIVGVIGLLSGFIGGEMWTCRSYHNTTGRYCHWYPMVLLPPPSIHQTKKKEAKTIYNDLEFQ